MTMWCKLYTHLLHSGRNNLKIGGNVTAEHAGLQCLDMTSHVRLRSQQMTLEHTLLSLLVPVRHYYLPTIGLDLRAKISRAE
jgi:hypothetical protein